MTNTDKIKLAQNIAVIAGLFSAVVALLLLLNFWQISKSDPIESKALEVLVERLKQEPNNDGLKAEIRNYDLLARKAYFNSQWQIKTGALMLLFGAIILAFALRVYYSAKAKIEAPDKVLENEIASRILAQKGIIIVGAVVFLFAFAASFATVNYLDEFDGQTAVAVDENQFEEKEIEVVEVGNIQNDSITTNQTEVVSDSVPVKNVTEQATSVETVTEAVQTKKTSFALTAELIKKNHNSFRGPFSQGVVFHKNIPAKWDGAAGTNIAWKSPIPKHGYNSPVIWDDKIFVAGSDNQSREVYCFNRIDGKLLWTGKADNIQGSPANPPKVTADTGLSAPTLTTDGQNVYAIFATGDVIAFDMEGKRVWAKNLGVPDNHYGHSSSLIVWDNKLIVQYDTNKGGKLIALKTATGEEAWQTTRSSKISWASPVLAQVDGKYQIILTADPIVAGYDVKTGTELWQVKCMMGEVGPSVGFSEGIVVAANEYAKMVAINIKTQEILWENDEYLPEAASILAHNGLVIVATSYGVMACYDLKSGEKYWEHDVGKTLYSSPMFADGKLFMMDNDGVMRIYEFAKEMKLISENKLGEKAGTTPAFADGKIYIRGDKNLY
ncbi:MAG TPA: PQQ-binding-like beta-propeller repeat protein, partial [Draconibacterium sp.]|nr:PQQ-binding-like beta-propeller repeat protein [Draconibacterium sp.]